MRRAWLTFLMVLVLGLLSAPLAADAQQARKVYRIGVLANAPPTTPEVSRNWEVEGAFAAMTRERAGAVLVVPDSLPYFHARRIVDLAAKSRLPAIYPFREAVEAGGLMAYAASAPDMLRRAAIFVDKILKGAKPADPSSMLVD